MNCCRRSLTTAAAIAAATHASTLVIKLSLLRQAPKCLYPTPRATIHLLCPC